MKDYKLTVTENTLAAKNIYRMSLYSNETLPSVIGGQFLHIEVPGKLLRRPFGILSADEHYISIMYAVVGEGTKNLSEVKVGDELNALLPLGNGFVLSAEMKKIALLGGGIGAVPLLPVPATYPDKEFYSYLGFSCSDYKILEDEFAKVSKKLVLCSDDGSCGIQGYPLQRLKEDISKYNYDAVLACGPMAMVRALKRENLPVKVYVSLEERMGCGIGACLVCTCKIKRKEKKYNLRVCADGPVFLLDEVDLDE